MIKTIYKIVKPSDPMTIYIGSTKLTLNKRLSQHKYDKKNGSNLAVHLWLDDTCEIEPIEPREGFTKQDFHQIEYIYIEDYRSKNFNVINFQDGRTNKSCYQKIKSDRNHIKNKESGKNKEWSDKHNNKKCKLYHSWCSNICIKAKKEGLTSQEYRLKHNIPDYYGPKTKQ